jgi:hypothetical protein
METTTTTTPKQIYPERHNEISQGERLMLSVFAVMGLLSMGFAVGLMGLGMHFLPGAY